MFYLIFPEAEKRDEFIRFMAEKNVLAVFHYLSLHQSPFYINRYEGLPLPQSDRYSSHLVRLPLYYDLENVDLQHITESIKSFN